MCVCGLFPDAKERSAKRFSANGVFNYTSLLLSQEDDMLYVGAREALFALSLSDISKIKLQKNVSVTKCLIRVQIACLKHELLVHQARTCDKLCW